MKKLLQDYWKAFFVLGIFASIVLISSCGSDDSADSGADTEVEPTQTILELVAATEGLDSLSKYLNRYPSLTSILGAAGSYTFFAPTNEAFAGLLETPGFPSNIDLINPDIIEGTLAYHIVAGQEVSQENFTTSTELNTLYTDALTQAVQIIKFNSDGTLLTGSTTTNIAVGEADIAATNGIMHTTESVLIPPSVGATLTPILGTNAGTVLLGTDFSYLAQGITLADLYAEANTLPTLVSTLAGTTNHNVFAPSNATFDAAAALAGFTIEDYLATFTGEMWYGIISNHVVVGDIIAEGDMTTGATYTTALGETLTFAVTGMPSPAVAAANPEAPGIIIDSNGDLTVMDPTTWVNADAEIVFVNAAPSSNGTVHVIAGVLAP